MPPAEDVPYRRWLAYGAVAVAGVFLASMLSATEGHFVPQVVDLYVICQYARSFAEGHPFQYNAGDAPSTGATSLLFTAVLGVAEAVGIRGEGLVAFAVLAGAALYVVSVDLAYRLAAHMATRREAALAGASVLLGGPVVWGFLYGSDIAAFMVLFLWLTERIVAGSPAGAAVAATLLALTRPEGLPLALMAAAASRVLWPRDPRARWLGVPVAAGLAVLVVYRLLTGAWVNSSVADKSLFANYGLADAVALVAEYLIDVIRGLLLGLYPAGAPIGFAKGWAPFFFPPLALGLVALAVATVEPPRRAAVYTWAAMVAILILLVSPNLFMGIHFQRYLMWALPTLHVFTAVGLAVLTRRLAHADAASEHRLFAAGAVVFLSLGLLSTARFAALYGDLAGDVYRRDVAAAHWITRHLPRGVTIAGLATSIEYLTGHRNLNLHGVTSPAFFGGRTAERDMSTFEALGRLSAAERPTYLLTTPANQEASPAMQEIVDPSPLYRTNSLGEDLVLHAIRYDRVVRNRRPHLPATLERLRGLRQVDALNVGDPQDEQAHDYQWSSQLGNVRLHGAVRVTTYDDGERVADGGRAILGRESFLVSTSKSRDLVVVLRTTASPEANALRARGKATINLEMPETSLAIQVDGAPYRQVTFQSRPGWDEHVFTVEGRRLSEGRTRIELRGRYAAFHYWFFQ